MFCVCYKLTLYIEMYVVCMFYTILYVEMYDVLYVIS